MHKLIKFQWCTTRKNLSPTIGAERKHSPSNTPWTCIRAGHTYCNHSWSNIPILHWKWGMSNLRFRRERSQAVNEGSLKQVMLWVEHREPLNDGMAQKQYSNHSKHRNPNVPPSSSSTHPAWTGKIFKRWLCSPFQCRTPILISPFETNHLATSICSIRTVFA